MKIFFLWTFCSCFRDFRVLMRRGHDNVLYLHITSELPKCFCKSFLLLSLVLGIGQMLRLLPPFGNWIFQERWSEFPKVSRLLNKHIYLRILKFTHPHSKHYLLWNYITSITLWSLGYLLLAQLSMALSLLEKFTE